MKQILHNNTYEVRSPLGKRDVVFTDELIDVEFSDWKCSDDELHLMAGKETTVVLKYDGKNLAGRHSRGGMVTLTPNASVRKKFDAFFRSPRKVTMSHPNSFRQIPEIKKTSDIAVISNQEFPGVDTYRFTPFLREDIDLLFSHGYNVVMIIEAEIAPSSFSLLKQMTTLLTDRVGSVQIASSTGNTTALSEVQLETGKWSCFALSSKAWGRVKETVNLGVTNLGTSLSRAFKAKNLERLSTVVSRVAFTDKHDSKRKKFQIQMKGDK